MASAGADGKIRIWDLKSSHQLFEYPTQKASIWGIAFSQTGKYLATASETVSLWDLLRGGEPEVLKKPSEIAAESVAFSPNDEFLAAGDAEGIIRIWRVSERKEARVLKGHRGAVKSICFSSDGRRIASASNDGTVRLWDLQSGQELRSFRGHASGVRSVTFAFRDERLLSAADDSVRLWSSETGQQIRVLNVPYNPIRKIAFSQDGNRIALLDKNIRIVDLTLSDVSTYGADQVNSIDVAFSSDGRDLVSAHRDRSIRIWHATGGQQAVLLQGNIADPQSIALSALGDYVAVGDINGHITIWEARFPERPRVLNAADEAPTRDPVKKLEFTHDGRHLITVSYHHINGIWPKATKPRCGKWKSVT